MFIPLHDHNPRQHVETPFVTWGLIAITVLIHVAISLGVGFADVQNAAVSLGAIPSVVDGEKVLPAVYAVVPPQSTVLTYAFLHGDYMHLAGNMLFLWVFGDNVEDAMGHIKYLVFYGLCAVVAAYAHIIMHPGSDVPLVGASGAVAGIVAAYLILHPKVNLWILALGRVPLLLPAWIVLGFWIGFQFYSVVVADAADVVSWWAHIGGLVAGAVLVFLFRRSRVPLFDRGLG